MHDTGTSITASSSNYKRKDVMCEAESNSERASILKVRGSSGHTETSQMREEGKKSGIHFSPLLSVPQRTIYKKHGDKNQQKICASSCHVEGWVPPFNFTSLTEPQRYKSVGLLFKRDDRSWMGEVCRSQRQKQHY